MEERLIELRAIASIIKSMSYVEDNVRDNDYALCLLSQRLFECTDYLTDEFHKMKNERL